MADNDDFYPSATPNRPGFADTEAGVAAMSPDDQALYAAVEAASVPSALPAEDPAARIADMTNEGAGEEDPGFIDFSPDDPEVMAAVEASPHPQHPLVGVMQAKAEGEVGTHQATPEEVAELTAAPGIAPGTKGSIKVGTDVSETRITPRGRKVAGDMMGEEQAFADARTAEYSAQIEDQKKRLAGIVDKQKLVLDENYRSEKTYMDTMADIHTQQLEFDKASHDAEALAQVEARAVSQQYLAEYKQDMAGVRQLMQKSGNPLGGLDFSGHLVLAGAQFAQGFLGAKYGIQINPTQQIENWVEREMKHHQQAISNAANMAQSKLTLYGLAKANAKDEWEARTRLRGFVIDGLKSQLMVAADRFGSANAKADAMKKAADLDALQIQNDMMLEEKVHKQEFDNNQQAIARFTAKANASIEKAKVGADYARMASNERIAKIQNPEKPAAEAWDNRIADPITGEIIGEYDTNAPDTVVKAATESIRTADAAYRSVDANIKRLRKLYDDAKAEGAIGIKFADDKLSERNRLYSAQATAIIASMLKQMSGLSATDSEFKRHADRLQPDKMFQSGSNARQIDLLSSGLRTDFQSVVNANANGAGVKRPGPATNMSPRNAIKIDESGAAGDEIRLGTDGIVDTSYDADALTIMGSRKKSEQKMAIRENSGVLGSISPEAYTEESITKKTEGRIMRGSPTKAWSSVMPDGVDMPEDAEKIDGLIMGVLNPRAYRAAHPEDKTLPKDDAALKEILFTTVTGVAEKLKAEASKPGGLTSPEASMYQYTTQLLQKAQENPGEVYGLLRPVVVPTAEEQESAKVKSVDDKLKAAGYKYQE